MSNQPQQQQNRSQQNPEPPKWRPDEHTTFIIQAEPQFEERARKHLARKYSPLRSRVVTELNTQRITPERTFVVVYYDGTADVRDPQTGAMRERRPDVRDGGKVVTRGELPDVQEGSPVAVKELWEDSGENDGGVRLNNLRDESGREMPGLITLLARSTQAVGANGKPRATVRIAHRPDIFEISVRGT